MGFIIPGIIFIGSAMIKIAGLGVTDSAILASLWDTYVAWIFISIIMIATPLIIIFIRNRALFREFLLFEAGGFLLFSPLWFAIATEITGDSFVAILLQGIENGLAFPGPNGRLVGVNIGPIFIIPYFIVGMILGAFLIRPGFIERIPSKSPPPELEVLKEKPTDELEEEMPGVAPPVADSGSIDELRNLLAELSIPATIIDTMVNAGYATITDLISTSPDKLAQDVRIDLKMAQDIHLSVQKKVWFGGIE